MVHDGLDELRNGVKDELAVSALEGLAVLGGGLGGPGLGGSVEVVLTPETSHKLLAVNTELGGVHIGELGEGETPAVKSGTEGDGTLLGVDLSVTEELIAVGSDNDVGGLDGLGEVLVGLFGFKLELKEGTVELVNHENGADTLGKSLTKDSLGLDADTLNAVNDDESTVGNTESGSNLRGEIDVARGIDQVDQEGGVGGSLGATVLGKLVEERDTSGLDGNTTLLLVSTGILKRQSRGKDVRAVFSGAVRCSPSKKDLP
jgi:hypothetical protein